MRTLIAALVCLGLAAACSAAAAPPATHSGQVADADGRPVAEAEVGAWKVVTDAAPVRMERVAETRSGADGKFSFSAAQGLDDLVMVARKDGLALGWCNWRSGRQTDLAIVLAKPAVLEGRVVDDQGRPIAGATVQSVLMQGDPSEGRFLVGLPALDWLVARTDDQGRFAFRNVPAEVRADFCVTAPGKAAVVTLTIPERGPPVMQHQPGQADIKIVLPPESCLGGQVVEKGSGRPVAGVELCARTDQRAYALLFPRRATSDADGRFAIKELPSGAYTVATAPPAGGPSEWLIEPVAVELAAGQTKSDLRVEVSRGGLLEVRVVAAQGGLPIEKATVRIEAANDRPLENGYRSSNAEGLASLRLPAGQYVLAQVSGPHGSGFGSVSPNQSITLVEGRTERAEVKLPATPKLVVTVKDPEGKPAAGVEVSVVPAWGEGARTTDAAGRVELVLNPRSGLSGQDETLCILARAVDRDLAALAEVGGSAAPLEVKLEPAASLVGTVVDAAGRPVAGIEFQVTLWSGRMGHGLGGGGNGLKTDAQGRYEVKGLPPDQKFSLQVNNQYIFPSSKATGPGDKLGSAGAFVDFAVENTRRFEVEPLVLDPAVGSVSGTVVDAEGRPVAKVEVRVGEGLRLSPGVQQLQPNRTARSDDQGRFKLEALCLRRVDISCYQNQSYGQATVTLGDGAKDLADVQLVLQPERSYSSEPPLPKSPPSLVGRPLPAVEGLGLTAAALKDKPVLICFWDYAQRPSRHAVEQLAARAAELEKQGLAVLLVRAADDHREAAKGWCEKMKIAFPEGAVPAKAATAEEAKGQPAGEAKGQPATSKGQPAADKGQPSAAQGQPSAEVAGPLFAWGVRGLPWLILVDRQGVVKAEGFAVADLDSRLKALTAP